MAHAALILALTGCRPALPITPGWEPQTQHDVLLRLALVGPTYEQRDAALIEDIVASKVDGTIFTGGLVAASSKREWDGFNALVAPLAGELLALAAHSERRKDRKLSRFMAAFDPEMTLWSHTDFIVKGTTWRLVALHADLPGDLWAEQRYWVPKVVAGDDYDHLLVALSEPKLTLAGDARSTDAANLLQLVDDHAAPTALIAVLSGGAGSNELFLHHGSYGAVHVVAGNSGVAPVALPRWSDSLSGSLVNGYDSVLRALWLRTIGEQIPTVYTDQLAIRGWWLLEIVGREVELSFRLEERGEYSEVYRIRYTRQAGWVAE